MWCRRVTRIFRWGRGVGCVWAVKIQSCRGVRGHAPPGKFYNFWIALVYISRVFMVEKENVE